jgi:predicted RNA polymerase sigma factor
LTGLPSLLLPPILCGFSATEIAGAFISKHAAIEKRITRDKKVLATLKTLFDVTAGSGFSERLLCRGAMRLTALLLEHPLGRSLATYAMAGLMSLHAARLPGRLDSQGEPRTHVVIDQVSPSCDTISNQWLSAFRSNAIQARNTKPLPVTLFPELPPGESRSM